MQRWKNRRIKAAAVMLTAMVAVAGLAGGSLAMADEEDFAEDVALEEYTEVFVEEEQNLIGETAPDEEEEADMLADELLPEELGLIEETEPFTETEFQTEVLPEVTQTESDTQEVLAGGIRFAKDYQEVFDVLRDAGGRWYYENDVLDYAMEEAPMGVAARDSAPKAADTGAAAPQLEAGVDYSLTNLRDSLVDEADIVKTDGTYLYILKEGKDLVIVRAEREISTVVSVTSLDDTADDSSVRTTVRDMYVDGDRLIIVKEKNDWNRSSDKYWYTTQYTFTEAETYDISDRSAPVKTGGVWQDGSYKQSRKIGDTVYLYSWYYPELGDTLEESDIVPVVNNTQLEASKICIPQYVTTASYLVVSSFNTQAPDQSVDAKVLISGSTDLYVSSNSLYVMNEKYTGNTIRTEIVRFACADGQIKGVAAARVKGEVNDSFSIDEYNGNLRVLTTYTGSESGAFMQALSDIFGFDYYDPDTWTRHNALYILDENMHMRSKLSGIAEYEEIKSARYFGDTVYFVTYVNTDPLFTADLSDPDAPKLIGELKVTGFSSYLHPYGEGRLLGIGYESDEESGEILGLKLSMFDVSDPTHVTEISRHVIDGITWCPAIEDYKAIYVEPEQNLAGFYVDERYMLFSFDETEGFERALLYDFYEDMLTGKASYDTMRAVRIQNEMYLAGSGFVVGFAMDEAAGFDKNLTLRF